MTILGTDVTVDVIERFAEKQIRQAGNSTDAYAQAQQLVELSLVLANAIANAPFNAVLRNEMEFERDLYKVIRHAVESSPIKSEMPVRHRDSSADVEGGRAWRKTKEWADVNVLGRKHSGDIVLRLGKGATLRCEVKWARERGTSALQSLVGQAILSSLRHPVTFAVLFLQEQAAKGVHKENPDFILLQNELLRCHNIFLIVIVVSAGLKDQ